jgi:hypothetical protein
MTDAPCLNFALRSRITAPVHCNQAANFFRSSMMIVQRTDTNSLKVMRARTVLIRWIAPTSESV